MPFFNNMCYYDFNLLDSQKDGDLKLSSFVKIIVARYILNTHKPISADGTMIIRPEAKDWLSQNMADIGFTPDELFFENLNNKIDTWIMPPNCHLALSAVANARHAYSIESHDYIERKIAWLKDIFNLDQTDQEILNVLLLFSRDSLIYNMISVLELNRIHLSLHEANPRELSCCLAISDRALKRKLNRTSPLVALGLVEDRMGDYAISNILKNLLDKPGLNEDDFFDELLPAECTTDVGLDDFNHLSKEIALATRLLKNSKLKGTALNLFIYGPTGSGKTSFSIALAKATGHRVVNIGEFDEQGNEPDRRDRLSSFLLQKALAEKKPNQLLIVDEAEDLFIGIDELQKPQRAGSKIYMNKLLSDLKVPVIFITNHLNAFPKSIIRRMDYVIKFPDVSSAIRKNILTKITQKHEIKLDQNEIHDIITSFNASPAILDNAARLTKAIEGGTAEFKLIAGSVYNTINNNKITNNQEVDFDIELINSTIDLKKLTENIQNTHSLDFSILAYGSPGTGKTAFIRHLAKQIELDILQIRSSDIFRPFVGESEMEVSNAFKTAKDEKKFLIFDEIDSLIRSRQFATRNWEVSIVNEMLSQMESHQLPIACTTNDFKSLDEASSRRFVFKIEFLPLNFKQIENAYLKFFTQDPTDRLKRLDMITLGDFVNVKKKIRFYDKVNSKIIIELLENEMTSKQSYRPIKIGYNT